MVKLVVRLSAWEEGQADGDAICSDDWLVLWLSGLTAGGVPHSSLSVWMVGWSAGREAVCLIGWLVDELSAWMLGWS